MIAPCFYFSNPVESYEPFGEQSGPLRTASIKIPEQFGRYKDTAYGYLYYGGAKNPFSPGYLVFLIGNNRHLEVPHPIWVDRNNNLDFTDDGLPDTAIYYSRYLDITIPGTNPGQGAYVARLSRFPVDSFFSYKNMINSFYGSARGKKRFADANHSFREQRMNILAADVKIPGTSDSLRIGLKDVNCNGFYNEPGIDQVLIGRCGLPFVSEQAIFIEKDGEITLDWELNRFKVYGISSDGHSLNLQKLESGSFEQTLHPGKKLPRFKYRKAAGMNKKQSIRSLRGKPLYIYVWNSNKSQFIEDSAALNRFILKHPEVRVLCLNYGDSPKWVAKYNQYYNTSWSMGFSSSKINDKIRIQYIPWGIYVDKKQRIILPFVHPPA
ncbi:MAG: hypothetical protein RL160_1624, partial [Bacteroidota bacterium]